MPTCKTEPRQRRSHGRPTKKTPQVVEALLKAIRTGAPYGICCSAVGLNVDTFMKWKAADPVFAAQVEKAAGETALRMLEKIEKHGEESFPPLAWILERRFPNSFSRPEVQITLGNTQNVTNNHNEIHITFEVAERADTRSRDVEREIEKLIEARKDTLPAGPVIDV
jgi:hypothetical protein